MLDTTLKQWLTNMGFINNPKGEMKQVTHVCMDGGKLYIPNEHILDFYDRYYDGIQLGEQYFICEVAYNKVIRFYCDFDFKHEEEITYDDIQFSIQKLFELVNKYFNKEYPVIICSTQSQKITENGKTLYKSGYHLIWENLYLSKEHSVALAKHFITVLNIHEPKYDWKNIVDIGVYCSGLRMIGSCKIHKVKATNKKGKKVIEKRFYTPTHLLPENDENEYLYDDDGQQDYIKFLKDCSIQNIDQHKTPIPENSDFNLIIQENISNIKHKQKEINEENHTIQQIRKYIRNYLIPEWDDEIISVVKIRTWYSVRTKARHCLNRNGNHKSENIYFVIYRSGFTQKCFCKCNTKENRVYDVCCKDFTSEKFKLSEELFKHLFPNHVQRPNEKLQIEKNENMYQGNKLLTKKNLSKYLKMSLNTIKNIEKKI